MATKPTESQVNSTQNNNTKSTVKGDNGFCILSTLYNSSSEKYIQEYMALSFDSVPSVGIKKSAEVTSYPVETGAEVSDHVQIKNNTFTMSGMITETPVRLIKDLLYSAGVNGTRISTAITYLDKIYKQRQPITLITEHEVFNNVILKGIAYDYQSEFAMKFDLDFEQIRIVSYGETNAIAFKTSKTKNTGATTKKRVEPNADLTNRVATATGTQNLNNDNPSGR